MTLANNICVVLMPLSPLLLPSPPLPGGQGTVEALYLVEGELISAGIDGFVRVRVMGGFVRVRVMGGFVRLWVALSG